MGISKKVHPAINYLLSPTFGTLLARMVLGSDGLAKPPPDRGFDSSMHPEKRVPHTSAAPCLRNPEPEC
jgi:hypothetical protein